jgi:hypothetical protein
MFKKLKIDTALFLTIVFALGLIAFFSFAYYHERMRMREEMIDVAYHVPDEEKIDTYRFITALPV